MIAWELNLGFAASNRTDVPASGGGYLIQSLILIGTCLCLTFMYF